MLKHFAKSFIASFILAVLYDKHVEASGKPVSAPLNIPKPAPKRPSLRIDAHALPMKVPKLILPGHPRDDDDREGPTYGSSFSAFKPQQKDHSSRVLQPIAPIRALKPLKLPPGGPGIYNSTSSDLDFSESDLFKLSYEHEKQSGGLSTPTSTRTADSPSPNSFMSTPSPVSPPSLPSSPPSFSSSSSSSSSFLSSLSTSTYVQSEHSGHQIRFDFSYGVEKVEGIPLCKPRSFKFHRDLFETDISVTSIAIHIPTRAKVLRKDVVVDSLKEFTIQSLVAEKTDYAPRVYCIDFHAKDHFYLRKDLTPTKRKEMLEKLGLSKSAKPVTVYMEYFCGKDLHTALGAWEMDSSSRHATIRKWMLQIYNAINSMHFLQVLHLDIKPENFVLNCQGEIRIVDFGFAVMRKDNLVLAGPKGTHPYTAPEVYSKKADCCTDYYAFGVMLAVMFELNFAFVSPKDIAFKQTPESVQALIYKLTGEEYGRLEAWCGLSKHPFFTSS